jgi:hypothetical protein
VLAEELRTVELDGRLPVSAGEIRFGISPSTATAIVFLDLVLSGAARAANRYLLGRGDDFGGVLDLPPATVTVDVDRVAGEWCLRLAHRGGPAAAAIRIEDDRDAVATGWATPDDDGFDLLPGEERSIRVRWDRVVEAERRLRVDAWNVAPMMIS